MLLGSDVFDCKIYISLMNYKAKEPITFVVIDTQDQNTVSNCRHIICRVYIMPNTEIRLWWLDEL